MVVGAFASNLARTCSIIEAAKESGREIILCGRSFWRLVDVARDSGYLQDAPKFHSDHDIGKIPRQ